MKRIIILICTLAVLSSCTEGRSSLESIATSSCTEGRSSLESIATRTVMITNLEGTSGGSGSILSSSNEKSSILTNAHVCGVVKNGGLVHTHDGLAHFVISYKVSKVHDLCLLDVGGNLHEHNYMSAEPPELMSAATVSGHPHLLPVIVTTGHFTKKRIIQVMGGFRDCTEDDFKNSSTAIFCLLTGKLPMIRTYEAVALSALIQPGSSGSAVYGEDGGISAVIFAGSSDIGYGYAVPYEYVRNFVKVEAATLESIAPNTLVSFGGDESKSRILEKYSSVCDQTLSSIEQKNICQLVLNSELEDLIETKNE